MISLKTEWYYHLLSCFPHLSNHLYRMLDKNCLPIGPILILHLFHLDSTQLRFSFMQHPVTNNKKTWIRLYTVYHHIDSQFTRKWHKWSSTITLTVNTIESQFNQSFQELLKLKEDAIEKAKRENGLWKNAKRCLVSDLMYFCTWQTWNIVIRLKHTTKTV